MERLQELLADYNRRECNCEQEWHLRFSHEHFPLYWNEVYRILSGVSRDNVVAEIGCGFGDIAAIPLSLGFRRVIAIERDPNLAKYASRKLFSLFGKDVVIDADAVECAQMVDVLIMVNCVYEDGASTCGEYRNRIRSLYERFGRPSLFIYEGVVLAPESRQDVFPQHIWMPLQIVQEIFPETIVREIPTYTYPGNSCVKSIYVIEREDYENRSRYA